MNERAHCACITGYAADGLEHSRFVIGPLDGDERPAPDRSLPTRPQGRRHRPHLREGQSPSCPSTVDNRLAARTDECSTLEVTSRYPANSPAKRLCRTMLFASVAPLVNTTSSAVAPSRSATCSRAFRIWARARSPAEWTLEAFPYLSAIACATASITSGRARVVELLSK